MRRSKLIHTDGFRITVILSSLFVSAMLILMGVMYWEVERAMTADFFRTIEGNREAIQKAYRHGGQGEVIEIIGQLNAGSRAHTYLVLLDQSGKKVVGNMPEMTPVFERTALPPPPGTRNAEEHTILGEGERLPDGSYVFIGADSYQLFEAQETIAVTFAVTTALVILIAVGAGFLFSRGALSRIDRIVQVCEAIAGGKWDKRINVGDHKNRRDILATTINDMLDRIEMLMNNLRQVSTDIAHDLRTPLTHMRQRLERAQREATSADDYGTVVNRAITDADEILGIFSALLNLAQIEAGFRSADFSKVDLSRLLRDLAETFRPVADDRQQVLEETIAPHVEILGDRPLLMQMFSNLIENAIRHSPPGASIKLTLDVTHADHVTVHVTDNGPGIPAADRARVFDRFWRAERSRSTPGNGLGLAIAGAVAKLHRATVNLADNTPGLAVELRIPR